MRRTIAFTASLAFLAWPLLMAVPSTSAFPLTTCTLTVTSRDASGGVISTATGSGPGGTQDDPLLVDPNGTVEWTGTTGGSPIPNASYHIEIFGVPTPLQGSATGDSPSTTSSGRVDVGETLPIDLTGLVFVSGALNAGGSPVCEGSGWIQLRGDPVGTPGFVAGAGLALIGLATVFASAPGRHPFRGAIGGLIGGAGLALLSGVTGVLPLSEQTPLAEVIGAVILGLAIGVIDFSDLFRRGPIAAVEGAGATDARPSTASQAGPATVPATEAVVPSMTAQTPGGVPSVVVPPVVVQPVVPAPQVQAPATAPQVQAPATAPPEPGLETIRAGVDALEPEVKQAVSPLFEQAETILHTGPGTLTIGSDVIGRILSQAGANGADLHLVDGAIEVGTWPASVEAKPVISGGKVSLSLASPIPGVGSMAEASDAFEGLQRFVEHVNTAVSDAGQSIASVAITPSGIVVTTGPAIS